jgi:adenylate cyclase
MATGSIDFAAAGLLDGLEDDERAERIALLERLEREGFTLDELRDATAEGRLIFLLAERAVGGANLYTARDLAERAGVPPELVAGTRRAQGLPIPDLDARVFTETDADAAQTIRAFADEGLSVEQMLTTTRILGRGLAQAAESMRATALELVLEPGATELEIAERYAEKAARLTPLLGPMLEQMVRLHLRNMVATEAISAAERRAGSLPGAREVTIGFADLVGFTRMGEEVEPERLGEVADRLGVIAGELARPPVRLVKTIGDAAMLVSPEPEPLLVASLDLIDAAGEQGEDFPLLRVGVASGAAVGRAGDWFGRPVNLASRVTGVARAGSVLATREVRDAVPETVRWSSAGPKTLRGVGSVRLYRARRLENEREDTRA